MPDAVMIPLLYLVGGIGMGAGLLGIVVAVWLCLRLPPAPAATVRELPTWVWCVTKETPPDA